MTAALISENGNERRIASDSSRCEPVVFYGSHRLCNVFNESGLSYAFTSVFSGDRCGVERKKDRPFCSESDVINPFVNHRGVTVLGYLPWNNPLTLESILFGVASAVMLSSTVLWFSSFHTVMTSDKLVFLFGKTLPALGLMLSMSLRFVPKFNAELREVRNAQRLLFPEKSGLIPRIKNAVRVLSVMISRALEDSLETADSMKARGYGLKGRTAYSRYRMTGQDWFLLSVTIVLTAAIAVFCFCKTARFRYYPSVTQLKSAADTFIFYGTYAVLLLIPLILTVGEGIRWRKYESNI